MFRQTVLLFKFVILGEVFEMDSEDGKSSGVLPQHIQNDVVKENILGYRSSYFGKNLLLLFPSGFQWIIFNN